MYIRPYSFDDAEELLAMVRLADFYLALPILSSSVTAALLQSPPIVEENAAKLLVAAEQLKNPHLFRECIVYLVANFDKTAGDTLFRETTPHLYRLVQTSYANVCMAMIDVEKKALRPTSKASNYLESASVKKYNYERKYYKSICEECIAKLNFYTPKNLEAQHFRDILKAAEPLLRQNLIFPGCQKDRPNNMCYCAEVLEEDLPWDSSEGDW